MIDIFFDIVFAAVIFSRMGDGKNSGNLIFKKIFSGTNFNIIDGETGITFSTSGGSAGIDLDEIAFGTGTGITSSVFTVLNTSLKESILGLSSVRFDSSLNKGSYVSGNGSFVIGGETNSISSDHSIIVGGKSHSISGMTYSVIISGCNNYIQDTGGATSFSSAVIGGVNNNIENGRYSSLISSTGSCIKNNMLSSVISSKETKIVGTQPYYFNINNTIISSRNNSIQNNTILTSSASFGSMCNNLILSSYNSTIIIGSTRSGLNGQTPVTIYTCNEILKHNVILSSNNSCINNLNNNNTISYNLLLSSQNSSVSSNFSSVSGRSNRVFSFNCGLKKGEGPEEVDGDKGQFSQILGGCGNYSRNCMSSIISSINSTISVGKFFSNSGKYNQIIGGSNHITSYVSTNNTEFEKEVSYSSIIGGSGNRISNIFPDKVADFTTILGGCSNCVSESSLIVAGKFNKTGAQGGFNQVLEITIFGTTLSSSVAHFPSINELGSGMIFGGYKNSAFKYSISIGGSCNETLKCSVIIGGTENCSAFQYNPKYFAFCLNEFGNKIADINNTFPGVCSTHNSYILGGKNNCTTSDKTSIIIGGCKNVTRNVNHSVIIGGDCNRIQAHGDFSGISNTVGGTFSEKFALTTLGFFYKPSFTPYADNIGNYSFPKIENSFQTQVSGNFIIGGRCNQFKSCFPNNYNCQSPYGYQWIYGTSYPSGLSNSSTSFVSNSGIVGGYRNCILNTYNLMGGIGYTFIPGSSGKYGGRLMNSVILGGKNLIVSKSNMVCASETIFAGNSTIYNPSTSGFNSGVSGVFPNPTSICILGGLIVSVT